MNLALLKKLTSVRILLIMAIASTAFLSCRDGGNTQTSRTANNTTTNRTSINTEAKPQNSQNAATNASSEYHYICVNNCEGSSANAAGTCPVCGEELVHNTAFHAGSQDDGTNSIQMQNDDENAFSSKITPLGEKSDPSPVTAPATGDASFHYVCSAGCGGGGNAQGTCPNCGAALTHNAAFHANQGATAAPGAGGAQPSGPKYPSVFNTPGAIKSAPVQNNSGAFHYLCSAGCGGGGNAQGSCPSCGAALAHNDAFHQ